MSEEKKLTRQEENWMLMTTLQIPWKDCEAIDSQDDRNFLLTKVQEVQKFIQAQERAQQAQQAQMARAGELSDMAPPQSPIITPSQLGL